jgi:hypothetical protein
MTPLDLAHLRRWLADVGDEPDDIAAIAAALGLDREVTEYDRGRARHRAASSPPGRDGNRLTRVRKIREY